MLLLVGVAAAVVVTRPPRLGLDLRGGTQIVLEAQDTPQRRVDADALGRTLEVLRRRVDQLGVAEPALQRSGDRRIIVELPGVQNPEQALAVIGRTAQLTFHPVLEVVGPEATGEAPRGQGEDEIPAPEPSPGRGTEDLILPAEGGARLRLASAALTGEVVGDAQAVLDTQQLTSEWIVQVSFRDGGGEKWAELTGEAACNPVGDPRRRVAIVLDHEVISSPEVAPDVECGVGIAGGTTVITGRFTAQEAKDLALLIRAGALPVPVEVVEQRTVGPSLGEAAIRASVQAALIGAALTILYMVAYYRLLGGLAAAALLIYGLLSFAVLLLLGATLTLPGVAGFVLAIGMAVDANVLVFERIKEEHAAGQRIGSAVTAGFKRAWSAIADSNATTILAAALLFFLASGAVRGFGITVTIGVAVSMFTALVVTRILVEVAIRPAAVRTRPTFLGMGVGSGFRRWLEERSPDLLGRSRIWFTVSAVVLALAMAGLVTQGLNLGLDFRGGRLLEYETARPANLDRVREELAARGLPRAIVQESGKGNVSVRTGPLTLAEERRVEEAVTFASGPVEKVRDEFVGATISAELQRKALWALGLALGAQLLYLAFRFRWTYGASAVAAMLHDVVILLGVFAWLGRDIDGVFVAALLTVVGYSINDSVVVFDRIREQRAARAREPLAHVANEACLQTIPRTINTGLGALFILVALYVLGGETLTDFALALIVGILVGTYSSIFTAAPLAVALERVGSRPPAGARATPAPAGVGSRRVRGAPGRSGSRRPRKPSRAGRRR
ncbi:MAG TPA: protein translocase subunit SecD [Actinomycetota bacterium]|nr:protein translocase subunit SecD [Actinomycetota bacterium]